ncbi:hypothetical protein [Hydrogenophaga pseudoflava]|uniref:hypothetical protein n=1 Tax=Hydrogenophaga pseudoflava TaxID=47421 RepID=UPI001056EA49|nr:hypothetical protein [Hydrogenophaga pseudoflava]
MKHLLAAMLCVFWLAVAYLPLALDREVTNFMVERNCMPGSDCLAMAMPLIIQVGLVGWAARVLLWPLAAWNLGGRWLWSRIRKSSQMPGSAA